AGDDALGGRLADALLDAREEALRHRSADDLLRELDAAPGVRLDLEPDVPDHPVAAGLLLVLALDPGRAPDRLAIGDLRLLREDPGPELPLEPLPHLRDVGVAQCDEELLAGGRADDPRRRLLLEHPLKRRAHLVE